SCDDGVLSLLYYMHSRVCMIYVGFYGCSVLYLLFFFFQAEDGIRDATVTGVQTCALPIWRCSRRCGSSRRRTSRPTRPTRGWSAKRAARISSSRTRARIRTCSRPAWCARSEERRVGKGWRCRVWACDRNVKRGEYETEEER